MRPRRTSLLLVCGLLTACSATGNTAAPVSTGSSSPSPSASSATSSATPEATTQATAESWRIERQIVDDKAFPVYLAWPIVPDAPGLTAQLAGWIGEKRASFQSDYDRSESAPPELNAAWTPVLDAPGGFVGVRETLWEFGGASGLLSSVVV